MKQRIYIAGPMRGYWEFNFPAFDAAAAHLRAAGYDVVSPAELDRACGINVAGMFGNLDQLPDCDLVDTVRRDVEAIINVDAIVLLPGWENSAGACAELALARWLRKGALLYPSMRPAP